jgi:steroid delta-isomerase-like uncharacterized protein
VDRQAAEALVHRWMKQGIEQGRLEVFDEILAPDVIDRSGPTPSRGAACFKTRAAAVRAAFAESEVHVDDLVVEGEAIAWRWALAGTHVGSFAGLAATGRRATVRGVNFQRVLGGKVTEHWTMVDVAAALQALKGPA